MRRALEVAGGIVWCAAFLLCFLYERCRDAIKGRR